MDSKKYGPDPQVYTIFRRSMKSERYVKTIFAIIAVQ